MSARGLTLDWRGTSLAPAVISCGHTHVIGASAGVVHSAVFVSRELAAAGSVDALHLSGTAYDLPLVRGGLHGAVLPGSGALILEIRLIAAIERHGVDAAVVHVGRSTFKLLREVALFGDCAVQTGSDRALSLRHHEDMALLVTGWNALPDVGFVALTGHRCLGLRRSHGYRQSHHCTYTTSPAGHLKPPVLY